MIGDRQKRVSDIRHLNGKAKYVADVRLPGTLHAAILRSPVAHARILDVDLSAAQAHPAVVAAWEGGALAGATGTFDHRLSPLGAKQLKWGVLATDKVRFVGEPIAVVVATTRSAAEDALDAVEVHLDSLPPVLDPDLPCNEAAVLLYPEWGTNEFLHLASETEGFDTAFAAGKHVLEGEIENHRLAGVPMEGHAVLASFDSGDGRLRVWASNQQPHQLRTVLAEIIGMPEAAIQVVVPDMGGGFGNKQHIIREEVLVPVLSHMLGRPVQWLQDRTENLTASVHARDQRHAYRVSFDGDGVIAALSVEITVDVGNPVLYFSGAGPGIVAAGSLPGGYAIKNYRSSLRCIATTKCPTGAYRGFGQPEAHLTMETVIESIARHLRIDPLDVRERNLVPDDVRPWRSATGARLDVGPFSTQLRTLREAMGYDRWRERQALGRKSGRYLGLAASALVLGTAPTQFALAGRFGGYEVGAVSVLPDGSVRVSVGTCSQGQGHETALAQVAARALGGIPESWISLASADTDQLPYGMGTWGSRTAVMAGGALTQVGRTVRCQMRQVAAALLDVTEHEVDDAAAGAFISRNASLSFKEVAAAAWLASDRLPKGVKAGLSATAVYDPRIACAVPDEDGTANYDQTYSSHVSGLVLECNIRTGEVQILDVLIVSDCGCVINPALVEQQLQGGFVQGASGVLREELRYNVDGQPEFGTLGDYPVAVLGELPAVRVVHIETPSALEGGYRGVGEAATVAAPALIVGALNDALAPLDVRIDTTALRPRRLRAILEARAELKPGAGISDGA